MTALIILYFSVGLGLGIASSFLRWRDTSYVLPETIGINFFKWFVGWMLVLIWRDAKWLLPISAIIEYLKKFWKLIQKMLPKTEFIDEILCKVIIHPLAVILFLFEVLIYECVSARIGEFLISQFCRLYPDTS